MKRAAIYARISLDRKEGAGVARQLADCRALAAERGFEVVAEFVDNDVSASTRKPRPEWLRLVAGLGSFDVLLAYHPDRLYRQTRDLEDLIDAIERVEVVTVRAGDMDLSTASGRMVARMLGAASRHEAERMGERVSRAKRDRAAQGRPPGGGVRAFGWKPDKVTIEPREARALKGAAERVTAGGSVGAEVRRLHAAGFTTTAGRPWTAGSLGRVLRAPRIAGLRAYRGEVVGPAVWRGIIDEPTWRRLLVMIDGRRGTRSLHDRALLSALIACPHCGRPLYTQRAGGVALNYVCAPSTRQGCGRSSIAVAPADAAVAAVVERELDDPSLPEKVGAQPDRDDSAELDAIAAKRRDLTRRFTLDLLDPSEYDEALGHLARRVDDLGSVKPVARIDHRLLVAGWRNGTADQRRAVVEALIVCPIPLAPGRAVRPGDRLTLDLREM